MRTRFAMLLFSPAWRLAAEPETCDALRFAREVELACDAMGGACRVVASGEDRVATLRCAAGEAWMLEARDANGARLWSVAIDGDDRLHRAALWLARSEVDAPPRATSPAPITPAPSSPSLTLAPSLTPSPAPAPAPAPGPDVASPAAPRDGGLALSARTVLGSGFGAALGANAAAGFAVGRRLSLGILVGGERALGGPSGWSYSAGRTGASLGWGAPWNDERFGAAMELGAMLGVVSAPASISPSSKEYLHPYAQLSLMAQASPRASLRPFFALSALVHTAAVQVSSPSGEVATVPIASASFDVGIAWRTW